MERAVGQAIATVKSSSEKATIRAMKSAEFRETSVQRSPTMRDLSMSFSVSAKRYSNESKKRRQRKSKDLLRRFVCFVFDLCSNQSSRRNNLRYLPSAVVTPYIQENIENWGMIATT